MTRVGKAAVLSSILAGTILAASGCAVTKGTSVATAPAPVDWPARLAEADALYMAGHYSALREARRIYGEALAALKSPPGLAEKYLRASLAFELRRRDLGVRSVLPMAGLDSLVTADPSLSGYAPWLEFLAALPSKIKGSPGNEADGGRTIEARLDWVNARAAVIDRELERSAATDDLAAALRLALRSSFGYKFPEKLEAKAVIGAHPGSRLAAFEAAVAPAIDVDGLEALLALEPAFHEAHYFLGEAALAGGKLLTAERLYLDAAKEIPESLSVLISLAKVAFQMEETEACLDWNEKALSLLPTYRDALLGKGLCLGALGRNDEALAVLGRLLELGTYYLGEAHYWRAWNFNDLGRYEEARRSVESAKVFLVDVVDVHTLSGIIAYRQGRLDDAEKDLRHALDLHSSESDAAYYLGRLYADRKDWLNSGIYFAGAATSYEGKEQGLEEKIAEIEASEMAADRKARQIAKKRAQIQAVQLTKATCQYNGAAGYHNAGSFERALDLARLAAAHPAFAERAAELIKIIQDR